LIRTQPACGSGISRSTISNGAFGLGTCTARIFFAITFSIDLFFRKDKGAPPFRMEERAPPRPTCALLPRTNKFSEAEFQ
jgi:hypothetical protein